MTDETGNTHPDPDDAVRRLLADARHSEPMPADVAARMDDVLAGLADGSATGAETPGSGADPAPIRPAVASLAAERRRRAAGMLVAAAAIVVGGVVVAQHLPSPGGSQSGASAAEDRVSDTAGSVAGGSSNSQAPEALSGKAFDRARATVRHGRVVVHPQHFTSDAFAARRLLGQMRTASQAPGLTAADPSCAVVPAQGKFVNATYERAPAVLVFRRPVSTTQVVDLFVCGSRRPVRSATLPHP